MSEYDFWLSEVMRRTVSVDLLNSLQDTQQELNKELQDYVRELKDNKKIDPGHNGSR